MDGIIINPLRSMHGAESIHERTCPPDQYKNSHWQGSFAYYIHEADSKLSLLSLLMSTDIIQIAAHRHPTTLFKGDTQK